MGRGVFRGACRSELQACVVEEAIVDGCGAGNFTARGCTKPILKQFIGDFVLENGATVHIRSFGQFNITLWDLVMEEFGLLTERDVLMVNFGAWCVLPSYFLAHISSKSSILLEWLFCFRASLRV